MRVKLRYLGLVRNQLGIKEEEVDVEEGAALSNLLEKISKTHGENLKKIFESDKGNVLDPTFIITVNGVLIDQLHGMNTKLKNGDRVELMTVISGG